MEMYLYSPTCLHGVDGENFCYVRLTILANDVVESGNLVASKRIKTM